MFNWFKKEVKLDERCKDCYKYESLHPFYSYLECKNGCQYSCNPCKIELIRGKSK